MGVYKYSAPERDLGKDLKSTFYLKYSSFWKWYWQSSLKQCIFVPIVLTIVVTIILMAIPVFGLICVFIWELVVFEVTYSMYKYYKKKKGEEVDKLRREYGPGIENVLYLHK